MTKFIFASTSLIMLLGYSNATCDQTITNKLHHSKFGNLKAKLSGKKHNGSGWGQAPNDINYNAVNTYKVNHPWWSPTGALYSTVNYDLLDTKNVKIAEIQLWNTCDEHYHKTESYISMCKTVHEEDRNFCNDIGLINVQCKDGFFRSNNQRFSATLVADNSGIQRNDYLCAEKNLLDFVGYFYKPAGAIYDTLVDTFDLDKKRTEIETHIVNIEAQIKNIEWKLDETEELRVSYEQIKLLSSKGELLLLGNSTSPNPEAEVNQTLQTLIRLNNRVKALAKENEDSEYRLRVMINNLKNKEQSLVAINKLVSNVGGIGYIKLISEKVALVVSKALDIAKAYACQITFMASMALSNGLDVFIKTNFPMAAAFQTQPICLISYEKIPKKIRDKVILSGPFKMIVNFLTMSICSLKSLFSGETAKKIVDTFCGVAPLSNVVLTASVDLYCGMVASAITDAIVYPFLCQATIFGNKCSEKLSFVCDKVNSVFG
eukprot:Pgem_evm1s6998